MSRARDFANLAGSVDAGGITGKNLVVNGAMNVAQRATSTTGVGASNDQYGASDRFCVSAANTSGRLTMSQAAVTDLAGFANCLKLVCTTADTSIASDEYLNLSTRFEGQNLQQLKKGTSSAEPVTVSFYVKGNASATYVAELFDNDNTRQYSQLVPVTSSWNRVSLTYAGDTTGALDDDNARSLQLIFHLHAGSNFTSGTLSTAWSSNTNANRAAGITSIVDSTDRTLEITGVQLEIGEVATPFEHRSFADDLALCQRYYFQNEDVHTYHKSRESDRHRGAVIPFFVEMRATPTVTKLTDPSGFTATFSAGGKHAIKMSGTAPSDGYVDVCGTAKADAEL